jgi:hypothetical protein
MCAYKIERECANVYVREYVCLSLLELCVLKCVHAVLLLVGLCVHAVLLFLRGERERECVLYCALWREKESAYVYVCVGDGCVFTLWRALLFTSVLMF